MQDKNPEISYRTKIKIDFNDLRTQPRRFFCPHSNSNCIYLAYKSHRESYTYAGFGMRERNVFGYIGESE